MANLILCHGFNVADAGKQTLDKLVPHLPFNTIYQADYGYFNLIAVRFFNDNIASVIAGMSPINSIGIGHSNGCAILLDAAKRTSNIKHLILINPALDNDIKFPAHIETVHVFHNRYDNVVEHAAWLPFHRWGNMGRVGYQGKDNRVFNHETYHLFKSKGHSDILQNKAHCLADYLISELDILALCKTCGRVTDGRSM